MVQYLASPDSISGQVHAAKQPVASHSPARQQFVSLHSSIEPSPHQLFRVACVLLIKPFRNHTHERRASRRRHAVVERGSNTCETKSKVSPEKLSATFNSNCFAKTYWHRKLGHICRVTQRNRNPKLLNLSQSRTPASCLVVCPTFVPALPSGKQEPDAMAPPWMKQRGPRVCFVRGVGKGTSSGTLVWSMIHGWGLSTGLRVSCMSCQPWPASQNGGGKETVDKRCNP